jgi:hypothetical protein
MRKSWSAFAVLVAAVLVSTSSASAAEIPTFGVLGGIHLANLALDPDPDDVSLDSLARANIGGFAEFGLAPNLSLQARAMYVRKGARLEQRIEEVDLRAETTIDYITVPVLLKIRADTAKIRPYVVVGPEIGFKTRAGASLSTNPPMPMDLVAQVEEELNDQVKDNVSSTDVALDFGGGIEIPARRMSFLVEGIYSLGLRNIATDSEDSEGYAKTRTFLFNVGIRF